MKATGNINVIKQFDQAASFSLTLQDTNMVFSVPPDSMVDGYLFFNYYIAGGGGLIGQITPDNATIEYLVATSNVPFFSNFGAVTAFTQLGAAALAAFFVHFHLRTAVANTYRVQFAQLTGPDTTTPTYVLGSSSLFYTLL